MAGRYEHALKVMERQTPDNYDKYAWVERAASFAVLGRQAEAQATVKEALKHHPDLTVRQGRAGLQRHFSARGIGMPDE